MKEVVGDLWAFPADFRCITTNGIVTRDGRLVMGAGNALEARLRFSKTAIDYRLGTWVKRHGNRCFILTQERLITFPTKHDWRDKSIPELIALSTFQLLKIVEKFKIGSVVLPRPGCGNGGLSWPEVKPLMECLDDRFAIITTS